MNILDMIVLLLILWLGIAGFREGLVRGVTTLLGFILTVLFMALFAGPIGDFSRYLPLIPHKAAVILSFLTVFIVGSILFAVLGVILRKIVHLTPLGFLDSGLGAGIGIFKAVIAAGVLAVFLSLMTENNFWNRQYQSSFTGPPLTRFISRTIPVITSGGIKLYKHFYNQSPTPEPRKQPHVPSNTV